MITRDAAQLLAQTKREAESLARKLPPHREGEVLVRVQEDKVATEVVDTFEATVLHRFDKPLYQLKLPPGVSTAEAVAAMGKMEGVEYVEPNLVFELQEENVPNDLDNTLWGLNNTGQSGGKVDADIDAPEAWAIYKGSRQGPVIAVLDSGADLEHPDLAANLWNNPGEVADGQDNDGNGVVDDLHGYHAVNQSGRPQDGHSHGSHCAGTIGAVGNNRKGVVGVNWEAQIMPVKIYGDNGESDVATIVRGIEYATANGARITSNSWGSNGFSQSVYDAFAESPALHIAAAGNEKRNNEGTPFYPASFELDNIISVAATSRHDELASFSNYGAVSVDLAAPGVTILSTVPGGYGEKSGTSMAAPHVAGVAGLIAGLYPEADNREIKARILGNVDKVGALEGRVAAGGRLNAARALEADELAPATPEDFRVLRAAEDKVFLGLTASGDDGMQGQALKYDLRMSDQPIADETAFARAQKLAARDPAAAGAAEEMEVLVVPSRQSRQVHFALRIEDNVGNRSELRSASATLPAADLPFEDPITGDPSNWTPDEGWAQVQEAGRGWVWTDSPDGNYENGKEVGLTTPPINLEGRTGATLRFEAKHDMEDRHDKVKVQVYEGGWWRPWRTLAELTGKSDWKAHAVDLSRYDGEEIKVRFLLDTDRSAARDGIYLDNVSVSADPISD